MCNKTIRMPNGVLLTVYAAIHEGDIKAERLCKGCNDENCPLMEEDGY